MKQKENVKEEVKEEAGEKQQKNNFAQGSIVVNILKLAVPMTLAQLINVLYNIVDRLYIGQLKDEATISLTGLGLCLPIISIVIAFANLFGMNSFINSQGFGTIGMMTVLLGAVANIILDPVFIFFFHMGVRGAALATILSQLISAIWILKFLTGPKAILKLKKNCMKLKRSRVLRIIGLGMSGFTMSITNSSVQVMYNAMLQKTGGDLYVGIMTVINTVREVISMPVQGITHSSQPVMGYNYGAKEYGRVKKAIVFVSAVSVLYTLGVWSLVHAFPEFFIRIFNRTGDLVEAGISAMRIYFFGFFMMAFQFAGQAIFVGLGKAKNAVFFSIFRKVIIVIPLIIILPSMFHMGTDGILMAEPVSNFIGGTACFVTMLCTVWPELTKGERDKNK